MRTYDKDDPRGERFRSGVEFILRCLVRTQKDLDS